MIPLLKCKIKTEVSKLYFWRHLQLFNLYMYMYKFAKALKDRNDEDLHVHVHIGDNEDSCAVRNSRSVAKSFFHFKTSNIADSSIAGTLATPTVGR